ncbi:MAG TPA: hypothetical protein VGB73_03885 [Pyrinomonadaceae bacterium]|jgi:hypothetical protein
MRKILSPISLVLALAHATAVPAAPLLQDAAKSIQPSASSTQQSIQPSSPPAEAGVRGAGGLAAPLTNRDISEMARAKLETEIIVAKIKASTGRFDTSPAALQQLKSEGVPDAVLLAMVMSPGSAASQPSKTTAPVKIPAGTIVDVEAAYDINSQLVRDGDAVSFRVVNPVRVGGVIVIAAGATATGRIERAARGGHFGKAGLLVWNMQEVAAVDGTRVPLEFATRQRGDSKGAKVATQTVVMGALLGPFAPLSLLHGFKRGGNAVIPAGKRFGVFVKADSTVNMPQPR